MPRRRTLAILTLAALLAAAPFLPDSHGPDGALSPSGGTSPANRSAYGAVTPQMQAEIDRVVTAGLAQPAFRGKPGPEAMAAAQIRCATFEGLQYCLHTGWTEDSQAQVQSRFAVAARVAAARKRSNTTDAGTGDLDAATALAATARLSPGARAAAERDELTRAAASVAKVWVLRHEILGIPYPTGFLTRHPEAAALSMTGRTVAARSSAGASASTSASASASTSASANASTSASTSASPSAAAPKTAADYPRRNWILKAFQTAEQTRTYWCGPTTMQMIAWGWYGKDGGQDKWAGRLGTTSSGTDIGSMVRIINDATGWDRKKYAGPYITLDIGKFTYRQWYLLVMRHIHDYKAPLVMHPILLKEFYPYLDDDASGHYQVGRGYDKQGKKANLISYFEPWNQQRFDPSEPYIERVQWRGAYKSFRANKAHPFHNIGV